MPRRPIPRSASHDPTRPGEPWLRATSVARPRWRQVTATVRLQEPRGSHFWLDLDVPLGFTAPAPGQFAQILLQGAANPALLPRPMSVAGVVRRSAVMTLGFLYAPVGA